MTVKIIAENIIDDDHFIDATEQAGGYIAQPLANTANTGAFRLLSTGDIADFNYSGTATTDGDAGGTTVIDSALIVYGDDYFIGGTVNVTKFMQDSADYTESDTAGRIALTTANKITVTNADDDEEFYVSKDFTAAHFNGDFEHHTQINCTSNAAGGDRCGLWALTNTLDSLSDIDVASGDFLAVAWIETAGSNLIVLYECNGGVLTNDTFVATLATEYYLKIVRTESVGTYGTLYCYIYSNAAMTTLVDTLLVTLTEKQDFRYLNWVVAYEAGATGCTWNGTIQNFKIAKSETKAISDFAQTTGTLTTAAFTYQVNIGSSFTLAVDVDTRNFLIELIASGDAGDATFKWSHDGGTTYLGRDDPNQATWLGLKIIDSNTSSGFGGIIIEAADGSLVCIFEDDADDTDIHFLYSTDNGLTWGDERELGLDIGNVFCAKLLKNGRILMFTSGKKALCSDDNGLIWGQLSTTPYLIHDFVELFDGTILAVFDIVGNVWGMKSIDGGYSWSNIYDLIEITSAANYQRYPAICQCNNGDLICAYTSDEDAVNDFEIKCKISPDGGTTWGTVISIISTGAGGNDISNPRLIRDINGDVYCFADETAAGNIVYSLSVDNGLIWGAKTTVYNDGGANTAMMPSPVLVKGHEIFCVFCEGGADPDNLLLVRRGIWEAYSANACPTALNGVEQKLIRDIGLKWYGGAGILGDIWTMLPNYDYAMQNLITPSPSKPWRSLTDNSAITITLDAGANARFNCSGIGLFGCNVRTLSFQMNAADTWGGPPSVDEAVDFLLASGTVDAVSGNYIQDTSLMVAYKDHQLSKRGKPERYFLRATSGTESGNTWEILDNVGEYLVLDTTAAHTMGAADTFVIFQSSISKTFAGGIYRFIRISIAAQQTADNYYELGSMVAGIATSLTEEWGVGYGLDYVYDIDPMDTAAGGTISIKGSDRKRYFSLGWNADESTRNEMLAISDYIEGKNLCLIPDSSTLTTCYLVQKDGNIQQNHKFKSKFDFAIKLREVI